MKDIGTCENYFYNEVYCLIGQQFYECGYDLDETSLIVEEYGIDENILLDNGYTSTWGYDFAAVNRKDNNDVILFYNFEECIYYAGTTLHMSTFIDVSYLEMTVRDFINVMSKNRDITAYYCRKKSIVHCGTMNDETDITYIMNHSEDIKEDECGDDVNRIIDTYVSKLSISSYNVFDAYVELLTVDTQKQLRQGKIWWRY